MGVVLLGEVATGSPGLGQSHSLTVSCRAQPGSHLLHWNVGGLAVGGRGREDGRRVSRGQLDRHAVSLSSLRLDGHRAFVCGGVNLLQRLHH